MSITKLPDPLPKVHQCGCGSQAFHLCADGRVVCLQCRYIIESLFVISALQPHVEREAAAQAKSLADERRIQQLEDAVRLAIVACNSQHGSKWDNLYCKLDAALRVGDANET